MAQQGTLLREAGTPKRRHELRATIGREGVRGGEYLDVIWLTYDPLGQSVAFSEEARAHIVYEHPDLEYHVDAIRPTIEAPGVCTREVDGSLNYYRRGVLPAQVGKYLHVVVRPSQLADLEVRTAWPADFVDEYEERIW